MHFQLLHKPRCFRSGIRTMRVNSREPREPQYRRCCGKSHFRGCPSGLLPVWRVSSRDSTLKGRPGATDVRALISKNRELLTRLGFSTIKSARWNGRYLRGKYLFSQSFREIVPQFPEIWLAASTASNANLACYLFFCFGGRAHTHEWTQRGKIRRSKMFWERAEITVFVKYWSLFSLFHYLTCRLNNDRVLLTFEGGENTSFLPPEGWSNNNVWSLF